MWVGWRKGDFEEGKLLSDRQMLKHVVLDMDFEGKAKDGDEEQSTTHRAFVDRGRALGSVQSKVGVQVVHALANQLLDNPLIKGEYRGHLSMTLHSVEGRQQVSVAIEQIVQISTIRVAYIKRTKRLGICKTH